MQFSHQHRVASIIIVWHSVAAFARDIPAESPDYLATRQVPPPGVPDARAVAQMHHSIGRRRTWLASHAVTYGFCWLEGVDFESREKPNVECFSSRLGRVNSDRHVGLPRSVGGEPISPCRPTFSSNSLTADGAPINNPYRQDCIGDLTKTVRPQENRNADYFG